MKYKVLLLVIFVMCSLCTSSNRGTFKEEKESISVENEVSIVDNESKVMISEALVSDVNDGVMKFIINSLNSVNTGRLKSVTVDKNSDEIILNIVSEDDINYQVYLSKSNHVIAIKNVDTDEWVLKSDR